MNDLRGISLPFTVIVMLIFIIILVVLLLIWNITGFSLADVIFKNYTSDVPSTVSRGAL